MGRLEERACVVTGGGGLLGAAFVHALAGEGARVLVNDVDTERAESVAASVNEAGGSASAFVCSADSWENGAAIVDTCAERYGRVDCLVNSAHATIAKPLRELSEEDFRTTWQSHVVGHFACSRRAADYMVEQRGGSIVNLVSRAMAGLASFSAYSAAKGAILSATFSWALELAPHGIRVNAVSPAARHRAPGEDVNLRMPWRRRGGQSVDEMRSDTPPPESVAPLVVYLASDASNWVSGQAIFLSGDSLALVRHPLEDRFAFRPEGWDVESLEDHFRDVFGTALERPSMAAGPYRWLDGVGS